MSVLKIQNSSLPIGSYKAVFEGVETTTHEEYGDGLKWAFRVADGQHAGRECYRITKCEPTPKNSCGRLLAALSGASAKDGLEIDPDDFVGRPYLIIIAETQSGSTRVETVAQDAEGGC